MDSKINEEDVNYISKYVSLECTIQDVTLADVNGDVVVDINAKVEIFN